MQRSTTDFINRVKRSPLQKKDSIKQRNTFKCPPESSFDFNINQLVQSTSGVLYRSFDTLRRKTNKKIKKDKVKKNVKGFYQKPSLIMDFNQQIDKIPKNKESYEQKLNSTSEYSIKNKTYTSTSRNLPDNSQQNYFKAKISTVSSQKSLENPSSVERSSFKTTIVSRKSTNENAAIKKAVGEKLRAVAGK